MSKFVVPFNSEKINDYLKKDIDAYIIGIKGFSENFKELFEIEDVLNYIDLINKNNKEIFIDLNKLYFNSEIDNLKKLLRKLNEHSFKITGIMFSDISVLNIVLEEALKLNLIWDARHLGTNSYTINYLAKKGVNGAFISNEITMNEKLEIKKNTSANIFITLFGYINIATSSRKLVSNYFKFTKRKFNNEKHFITDKVNNDNLYPIIETENTNFFSNKILNGITYIKDAIESGIDYIHIDDYLLENDVFLSIIDTFIKSKQVYNDGNELLKLENVIESNISNNGDKLFLDKKSVFKVKDYE